MKVKTLIEKLQKLPKDANIEIFCSEDNWGGNYKEFTEVCIDIGDNGKVYINGTWGDDF